MQPSTPGSVRHRAMGGLSPVIATGRLVAGGFVVAGLASAVLAAEAPPSAQALDPGVQGLWAAFADWLQASYARSPALVLGLVALITLPPLALIGFLARRREETGDISQLRTQVRRVPRRSPSAEPRDGVRTGFIPPRPLAAWIEVVDGADTSPRQRYTLSRTLLRIGRETDNDVCIADKTVHRYHAAVRRTEDAEFVITDLSSAGGNGVVVNGRAVSEARLSNGDTIELGNARLLFQAAPG